MWLLGCWFLPWGCSCLVLTPGYLAENCDPTNVVNYKVDHVARSGLYVTSTQSGISITHCAFIRTYCGGSYPGTPGGGISITSNGGDLTITDDTFISCRAPNGWGAAFYAKVGSFVCERNTMQDFTGNDAAEYSVCHFDRYGTNPQRMTLKGLTFERVAISGTDGSQVQGGGSGLVLRFCSAIVLESCTFDSCSCAAAVRKAAGAVLFEANASKPFDEIKLKACTFRNCPGKGGCIYISHPVTKFVVEGSTTIDGCGGKDADHPYSISVNAREVSFSGLTVKGMDGGYGRIWLGDLDTSKKVLLTDCVFGAKWKRPQVICELRRSICSRRSQ